MAKSSNKQSVPGSKVFQGANRAEKQSVSGSKMCWGVKCSRKQSVCLKQSVLGSKVFISADDCIMTLLRHLYLKRLKLRKKPTYFAGFATSISVIPFLFYISLAVWVVGWCLKSSHDIDNSAIMWSVPMLLCIPAVMTLRLTWVVLLHVIFYREIVCMSVCRFGFWSGT